MIEKKKIFRKLDNRLFFTTKFAKVGNRQAKSTHRSIMSVGRISLKHGKKSNGNLVSLSILSVVEIKKTRNETKTILRLFLLFFVEMRFREIKQYYLQKTVFIRSKRYSKH